VVDRFEFRPPLPSRRLAACPYTTKLVVPRFIRGIQDFVRVTQFQARGDPSFNLLDGRMLSSYEQ